MTLVVVLNDQAGRTVAVADVLLTSSQEYRKIALPTRELPHEYDTEYLPTGFIQKLTFISDQVVFCWTGNREQARLFSAYLQKSLTDISLLPELIGKYPQDHLGGSSKQVCGLLLVHFGDKVSFIDIAFPYQVKRQTKSFPGIWMFGSGADQASDLFSRKVIFNSENRDAIVKGLIMMGHAMSSQATEGYGLDDAWGGGFQILRATSSGFELLNRVLTRAWVATGKGTAMKLLRGPFFFYFYIGEMLFVSRPWGEDGGSLASVPPLLKPNLECQFVSGSRRAQYVLDLIKHQDIGGFLYLTNFYSDENGPSVSVAPKNSYADVSDAELENLIKASRAHYR